MLQIELRHRLVRVVAAKQAVRVDQGAAHSRNAEEKETNKEK
jgi:hypothetical protein